MQLETFTPECQKLMEWFNKSLTTDQLIQIYRKISKMPIEAWRDIVEHLISEQKPTQANFPTIKQIRELYGLWRHQNPEKFTKAIKTKCKDCWSTGFIWVRIYHKPDYSTVCCFRCGSCENWQDDISPEVMPSITAQQVEERRLERV